MDEDYTKFTNQFIFPYHFSAEVEQLRYQLTTNIGVTVKNYRSKQKKMKEDKNAFKELMTEPNNRWALNVNSISSANEEEKGVTWSDLFDAFINSKGYSKKEKYETLNCFFSPTTKRYNQSVFLLRNISSDQSTNQIDTHNFLFQSILPIINEINQKDLMTQNCRIAEYDLISNIFGNSMYIDFALNQNDENINCHIKILFDEMLNQVIDDFDKESKCSFSIALFSMVIGLTHFTYIYGFIIPLCERVKIYLNFFVENNDESNSILFLNLVNYINIYYSHINPSLFILLNNDLVQSIITPNYRLFFSSKTVLLEYYNILLSFNLLEEKIAKDVLIKVFNGIVLNQLQDTHITINLFNDQQQTLNNSMFNGPKEVLNLTAKLFSKMINYSFKEEKKIGVKQPENGLFLLGELLKYFGAQTHSYQLFNCCFIMNEAVKGLIEYNKVDSESIELVKQLFISVQNCTNKELRFSSIQCELLYSASLLLIYNKMELQPLSNEFFKATNSKSSFILQKLVAFHILFDNNLSLPCDLSFSTSLIPLIYQGRIKEQKQLNWIVEHFDEIVLLPFSFNIIQWLFFGIPFTKDTIISFFNPSFDKDEFIDLFEHQFFYDFDTTTIPPIIKKEIVPDISTVVVISQTLRLTLFNEFLICIKKQKIPTTINECKLSICYYQLLKQLVYSLRDKPSEEHKLFINKISSLWNICPDIYYQNDCQNILTQGIGSEYAVEYITSQIKEGKEVPLQLLKVIEQLLRNSITHCFFHDKIISKLDSALLESTTVFPKKCYKEIVDSLKNYNSEVSLSLLNIIKELNQCNYSFPMNFICKVLLHINRNIKTVEKFVEVLNSHPLMEDYLQALYNDWTFFFNESSLDSLFSCFKYTQNEEVKNQIEQELSDNCLPLINSRKLFMNSSNEQLILYNLHFDSIKAETNPKDLRVNLNKLVDELLNQNESSDCALKTISSFLFYYKCSQCTNEQKSIDCLMKAFELLIDKDLRIYNFLIQDTLIDFSPSAKFFKKWFEKYSMLSNFPFVYMVDVFADFLKKYKKSIIPLIIQNSKAANQLLPLMNYSSIKQLISRDIEIVIDQYLNKEDIDIIDKKVLQNYINNHYGKIMRLYIGSNCFDSLIEQRPKQLSPLSLIHLIFSTKINSNYKEIVQFFYKYCNDVINYSKSTNPIKPDLMITISLFVGNLLKLQEFIKDETIFGLVIQFINSKRNHLQPLFVKLIFSSLINYVQPSSRIFTEQLNGCLISVFQNEIEKELVDIQEENYENAIPYPVFIRSLITNNPYVFIKSALLLSQEYRELCNSEMKTNLLYVLHEINDSESLFNTSFKRMWDFKILTTFNETIELILYKRATYLLLTLQPSIEIIQFIYLLKTQTQYYQQISNKFNGVIDAIIQSNSFDVIKFDSLHPQDIINDLSIQLIDLMYDRNEKIKNTIKQICCKDNFSSKLVINACIYEITKNPTDQLVDFILTQMSHEEKRKVLLPFISRYYTLTSKLYQLFDLSQLIQDSLRWNYSFSGIKFSENLRFITSYNGKYKIYVERPQEITNLNLIEQPLESINDFKSIKQIIGRKIDVNLEDGFGRLLLAEAERKGIETELRNNGLYHCAEVLTNFNSQTEVTDLDYSIAWRTMSDWGSIVSYNTSLNENKDFNLWKALKFNEKDALNLFSKKAFDSLKHGLIEEDSKEQLSSSIVDCLIVDIVKRRNCDKVKEESVDWIKECGVDYQLIKKLFEVSKVCNIPDKSLTQSKYARKWGYSNEAYLALLCSTYEKDEKWWREYAKIKYQQEYHDTALLALKNSNEPQTVLLSIKFKSQIHFDKREEMTELIQRIEAVIKESGNNNNVKKETLSKIHFRVAQYYDLQAQEIEEYNKSNIVHDREQLIELKKSQLKKVESEEIKFVDQKSKNNFKAKLINEVNIFKNEKLSREENIKLFHQNAILNYCQTLKLSNNYDLYSVLRILSIWFNCKSDNNINTTISNYFLRNTDTIDLSKLLSVSYQLIAKMNNSVPEISKILNKIIYQIALKYPQQTLWHILMLYNSNCHPQKPKQPPLCAKNLLDELSSKESISSILNQMHELSHLLIHFAYLQSDSSSGKVPFAKKSYPLVSIPICSSMTGDNCPSIAGISNVYSLVGGIRAPKKMEFLGSDNKKYSFLLKSEDDLRQDAVMQQLFDLCNRLFKQHQQTKQLRIRTYKVVPLTKESGMLEFVTGTKPLFNELSKIHDLIHPEEPTFSSTMSALDKAHKNFRNNNCLDNYFDVFNKCVKSYTPSFHNLFDQLYGKDPKHLYDMKLNYINSTAVSSIIGYVFGIGDRHNNNIMFDEATAEVIHIDFGIVFEFGKKLPIPEIVPFRLTREILDPMGVLKYDGPFKRCCENVLRILRDNKDFVLAILQAVLSAPPKKWTDEAFEKYLKQVKVKDEKQNQNKEDKKLNEMKSCQSIMFNTKEKLMGIEGGQNYSVEGQVNEIISQAADIDNIKKMYCGWCPWC
ncbi:hypothetical protein ENUP19_0254G0021 [Entamoeba nuttalli]|uniref:non-specific serine/threonine protein kinase n=1 Tax=Entamoeba nuttalli TaxID=412467 RepID=A0ABQ0DRN9_9EUKA